MCAAHRPFSSTRTLAHLMLALAAAAPLGAAAQESGNSPFKLSGFLSVIGGAVISGSADPDLAAPLGVRLPGYTADWSNAGVYENRFSLRPESRLGVQATYSLTSTAKLTAQIVSRGTDSTPNLAWAYGSFKLSNSVELQVGRKRIPLYYYSDFQDIGLAYPWVSPPPELYGWDATNYNGASVRYSGNWGDTTVTASVFGGQEDIKKSLYNRLYYTGDTRVKWNNILGADLEINRGPATVRVVYVKSDVYTNSPGNVLNALTDASYNNAALVAYGIAGNLDFDDWFVLSEATTLRRNFGVEGGYRYSAPAFTVGAGLRLGTWTPFLNYAQYIESSSDQTLYSPTQFSRISLTLRHDLSSSTAVKIQVDRHKDITRNFGGDVNVFRLSYDRVF